MSEYTSPKICLRLSIKEVIEVVINSTRPFRIFSVGCAFGAAVHASIRDTAFCALCLVYDAEGQNVAVFRKNICKFKGFAGKNGKL